MVSYRSMNESRHLTRSPGALRAVATLLTLGTFAGSSAFAATHLYNPVAPLRPTLASTITAGGHDDDNDDEDEHGTHTTTPLPTAPATTRSRSRTTITPSVGTTTRGARTRTGQS